VVIAAAIARIHVPSLFSEHPVALHASVEELFGQPQHILLIIVVSRFGKGLELFMKFPVHGFELFHTISVLGYYNGTFMNTFVRLFHCPVHGLEGLVHSPAIAKRDGRDNIAKYRVEGHHLLDERITTFLVWMVVMRR